MRTSIRNQWNVQRIVRRKTPTSKQKSSQKSINKYTKLCKGENKLNPKGGRQTKIKWTTSYAPAHKDLYERLKPYVSSSEASCGENKNYNLNGKCKNGEKKWKPERRKWTNFSSILITFPALHLWISNFFFLFWRSVLYAEKIKHLRWIHDRFSLIKWGSRTKKLFFRFLATNDTARAFIHIYRNSYLFNFLFLILFF